ncbi:MAG: restriction endonuclease subunit S, partial [Planktothrix sp.]
DKLIAKKRHIKTATMQQLLTGKTRLPGFGEGKGYKKTDIGVIPEDWDLVKFTDVTTVITCGIAATPKYVPEGQGYPFLSSTNVKNGQIVWRNFKFIDSSLHKNLYKNNPPKKGDILYSRVGTIGEAAVIEVDFEFSIYVSLTLIKVTPRLSSYFLTYMLNSNYYKKKANDEVFLGGGVGNLNVDVVRNYLIFVPSIEEQRAIIQVLSDIDEEISALEKRRTKTQAIKQGMMQELLTGRTRLSFNKT